MQGTFNWMDYVCVVILILCTLGGLTKGLILSIFNLAGFFIALYGAKVMTPIFSGILCTYSGIDESLNKYFGAREVEFNSLITPVMKMWGGDAGGVGSALTSAVILIMAFVAAFILLRVLIAMIGSTLDASAKLPVIKQFNRAGGFCFGIIEGLLIIYITFAILSPIIPMLASSNPIVIALERSAFAVNFYRYNFIIPWIRGAL